MNNINNQVQLIGHAGNDAEIITLASGKSKANLSLATSQSYKNQDGEYISNTQWHRVVMWGKGAEQLAKVVKKGDQVTIHGSIAYRNYQDGNGDTKYITEINADQFYKHNKKLEGQPKAAVAK